MFAVAEITEWDEAEPSMYYGGLHHDPKYKIDRPMWTGDLDMAEKFDSHEDAERFASDLTDYHATKGYGTAGFVVVALEEGS